MMFILCNSRKESEEEKNWVAKREEEMPVTRRGKQHCNPNTY